MKRATSTLALACLVAATCVTTLSAQALPAGHVICPVLENSRLVKGCSFEYRSAIKLGDAHETAISDCPAGSFHDPRNGGECWSCPAGFIRNVSPVFAEDACWKAVSEDLQPAKREANPLNSCPSGTFHDPRNGGECWSCPSGYSRTWDPVTSNTACHQYALGPTSPATLVTKFGCAGGTFFDPIYGGTCWSCPAEYRRTANHVETAGACAKTIPTQYSAATYVQGGCEGAPVPSGYDAAFFDPIDDGTCWSCPVMFKRSLMPVNENHACSPGGDVNGVFVWQSPQYPEPGLYRFLGRDVLDRALADPKAVDQFVTQRAGGDAAKKQAIWKTMLTTPGASAELKALALASLMTIAESSSAGIDGLGSLSRFEQYIRDRRMYVALDAQNMYEAWLTVDSYSQFQAARSATGISGMTAGVLGGSPPSFGTYSWAVAAPDETGGAFLDAMHGLASMANSKALTVTPTAEAYSFDTALLGPVFFGLDKAIDAYRDWALTLNSLGSVLGHTAAGMGAALGMIAVTQSIELANAISTLISKDDAAQAIQTQLDEAAKPVSLKELYKTDEGKSTLLLFWALGTSPYQASGKAGSSRISEAENCAAYKAVCDWTKWRVAQAAKTASSESMAAYQPLATSLNAEPPLAGAITIFAGTTQAIEGAPAAAVDPSGTVTTTNTSTSSVTSGTLTTGGTVLSATKPSEPTVTLDPSKATVTLQSTGTWTTVPGGLTALSAGPDGPWGINSSGNIWRFANGNWQLMPGAAKTVSVGPSGDVWVVNAAGEIYRWNVAKNNWDLMPGGLVDISAGLNEVWGVNSANQIWRYANGAWQQMPGAAKAVTIGPTGDVWHLGMSAVPGGSNIYHWNRATNSWESVDGGLTQISAGPDGLWGVNSGNMIFRHTGGTWEVVPGSAAAVSAGPSGEVWALGTDSVPGGHPVKKRN